METHIRAPKPSNATVADWANSNRRSLVFLIGGILAAFILVVVIIAIGNWRGEKAQTAFGAAMRVYETPVTTPGQPLPPEVKPFATNQDRAKAAYDAFHGVADKYGMTDAGKNAAYMAGVSALEMGQPQTAETELKKVADGWNSDRASLANLALAHLYRQTGRDAEAIALYEKMTKNPTATVPAGLAQIQLADLYEAENKPADAKKIYAALKDQDKEGKTAIGDLASRKLNGQSIQ